MSEVDTPFLLKERYSVMTHFLNCNHPNITSKLKTAGLNIASVFEIFFGRDVGKHYAKPVSVVHPAISQIIRSQMLASEPTFQSITTRQLCIPNVWTGEPMETDYGFATPSPPDIPHPMFPLFYYFRTSEGHDFWLVSFAHRSIITQIIIPSIDTVLFIGRPNFTQFAWNTYRKYETRLSKGVESQVSGKAKKSIGLVDQLPNYAHQMIHHLSGLDRLIENENSDKLDEIWIVGIEFFGKVEHLFPSLENKIKRFSSRDEVSDLLIQGNHMPYRLGCGVFRRRLQSQIIKRASECYKIKPKLDRYPLIAITLREQDRRCVNLEAIISRIMSRLGSKYPKLAFVLDGWVRPGGCEEENETAKDMQLSDVEENIKREQRIAERIVRELPQDTVIRNLVGMPMLQSIIGIADIDLYLSHVGTLQHKLGFFSCKPGVAHGPTSYMEKQMSFEFFSEIGIPPILLPKKSIIDGPNTNPVAGPGFCDYEISDPDQVVGLLEMILNDQQA